MILESKMFDTTKECKKETRELKDNIFKSFNVDKSNARLPRGSIILCGLNEQLNAWLQLSDVITDFNRWLKNPQYSLYKLVTVDLQLHHKQ